MNTLQPLPAERLFEFSEQGQVDLDLRGVRSRELQGPLQESVSEHPCKDIFQFWLAEKFFVCLEVGTGSAEKRAYGRVAPHPLVFEMIPNEVPNGDEEIFR